MDRKVELLASLGHKEALTVVKQLDIRRHRLVKESLELLLRSDRVQFAIDCAKRVLYIFENKYPDDNRPRKAIEAAELVLVNDTDETRVLAKNAANAAYTAAWTTWAADTDAADATDGADTWAAARAAWAAAYAVAYDSTNAVVWAATYAAISYTYAAISYTDKEPEIRIQNQQLVLLILQL